MNFQQKWFQCKFSDLKTKLFFFCHSYFKNHSCHKSNLLKSLVIHDKTGQILMTERN